MGFLEFPDYELHEVAGVADLSIEAMLAALQVVVVHRETFKAARSAKRAKGKGGVCSMALSVTQPKGPVGWVMIFRGPVGLRRWERCF